MTESYDGRMIVKHVLHGGDEQLRHAELGWAVVGVVGVALVPALARGIPSMLLRVGLREVGLVLILAGCGGKRLWRSGLREGGEQPHDAAAARAQAAA